jgi:hypothetical protein
VYRSVLAVIDPGPQVCFASVCRETLHAEALAASGRDLRAAVDTVPDDVPVTTVVSPLCLRRAVRREIARGGHDVVVIGSAVRRRWAAVLMRRLLRRCPAPVVRATPQAAPRSAGPLPAPLAGAG